MRTRKLWATALLGASSVVGVSQAAEVRDECEWLPLAQYWRGGCPETQRYYIGEPEADREPRERGGGYTNE